MHDDGLHFDGGAGDGIFGAFFAADEVGAYVTETRVTGWADPSSKQTPFQRSTQHMFSVVPDLVNLNGEAWVQPPRIAGDSERIIIGIGVKNTNTNRMYRGYAEVYATDMSGKLQPACWISSLVDVTSNHFELELNLNWLARLNLAEPIEIRNVYVDDMETNFPVTLLDKMPVKPNSNVDTSKVLRGLKQKGSLQEITMEMKRGKWLHQPSAVNVTAGSNLLTSHGYCAGSNPWKSHQFDNAVHFEQLNANMNHFTFAQQLKAFMDKNSMSSCGYIGHSQGGPAGLTVYNHFFSCLDLGNGGRLIQSVGSPYQGCSGAGNAANLAKIFGIACGANTDLTVDGAKNWLKGIDMDHRKDVYFWTTTYEQGKFFGDWCNLAVNLILQWPNDGTTELTYAPLPGGNSMGNKEKWCHTTDMGYPAQYSDSTRNANMNANAAR